MKHTHDVSGLQTDYFIANRGLFSRERWQAILRCKQDFLQNEAEDPRKHPYMDQDVAASWIRSRNWGVNPYSVVTNSNLSPQKLSEILNKNHALVDATKNLAQSFKKIIVECGYIFYLFDIDGVILLNEGSLESFTSNMIPGQVLLPVRILKVLQPMNCVSVLNVLCSCLVRNITVWHFRTVLLRRRQSEMKQAKFRLLWCWLVSRY
ncbi:MAG: norR 17 [Sporomusa sp.]|nr:norR 17 [Sporomusa sp.]